MDSKTPLLMGLTSWFQYEELTDDWLDLTDAEMYKGLLDREPLRAARWSQVFQGHVETPLHQRSSECVPLEILSVHPSKKRKHRDDQVDRQVFIAFEALKGCLDGHVTVVHHERKAKTKPVSCRRDSGEC